MKIKRKKRGNYAYNNLAAPEYSFMLGDEEVGYAVLTGRAGVDDYPWEAWDKVRGSWHAETLRNVGENLEYDLSRGKL